MEDKEFAALLAKVETELNRCAEHDQYGIAMYCMVQVIAPELSTDQVIGLVDFAEGYKKRAQKERQLQTGAKIINQLKYNNFGGKVK